MTPPALKPSRLSAATPICAPAWTGWRHSWKLRPGIGHMSRILSIFSAEDAQTASRGLYGKGTAGSVIQAAFGKPLQWPRTPEEVRELTPQQFRWLMEGLTITLKNRSGRWNRRNTWDDFVQNGEIFRRFSC